MYTDTDFPFDEDSFEDFDENKHAFEDPEVDSDEYWDDEESSLEEDLEDIVANCSAKSRHEKLNEAIANCALPAGMSLSPITSDRKLWDEYINDIHSKKNDSIFIGVNKKLLELIFEIENTPKYTFSFSAADILKMAKSRKKVQMRTFPLSTYDTKNAVPDALVKIGGGKNPLLQSADHIVLIYINDDYCDKKYLLCTIEKVLNIMKTAQYNESVLTLMYNMGDKNVHLSDSGKLYYENDATVHYIIMKNNDREILGNDIKVSLLSFYHT